MCAFGMYCFSLASMVAMLLVASGKSCARQMAVRARRGTTWRPMWGPLSGQIHEQRGERRLHKDRVDCEHKPIMAEQKVEPELWVVHPFAE